MAGLAAVRGVREFGDKVFAIDVAERRVPRRAVVHDAATALAADDRQRGRRRMRAALEATRNMQRDLTRIGRERRREYGGKHARRQKGGRAGAFARTGRDAAARI